MPPITGPRPIWLVCYKKGTDKPSMRYDDSVEEAHLLRVGRRNDQVPGWREVPLRFTPRKKRSSWPPSNLRRLEIMINEGKMTDAGLAVAPDDVLRGISGNG